MRDEPERRPELETESDDEAFEKLKQITDNDPDDKEAFWTLASLYYIRGYLEESLENYRKVLALDPMHKTTYNQMAYLYNFIGNFEKSVWAINQYIELAPGEPLSRVLRRAVGEPGCGIDCHAVVIECLDVVVVVGDDYLELFVVVDIADPNV